MRNANVKGINLRQISFLKIPIIMSGTFVLLVFSRQEFIRCNLRLQNQTLSFAFSQRFSPFKPIIPCAYWEACAFIKGAIVFQRLYFCPRFLFKLIDRLSMTFRQTTNGKNETFAICLQLSVQLSENICIYGEY